MGAHAALGRADVSAVSFGADDCRVRPKARRRGATAVDNVLADGRPVDADAQRFFALCVDARNLGIRIASAHHPITRSHIV